MLAAFVLAAAASARATGCYIRNPAYTPLVTGPAPEPLSAAEMADVNIDWRVGKDGRCALSARLGPSASADANAARSACPSSTSTRPRSTAACVCAGRERRPSRASRGCWGAVEARGG